MTTVSIIIPSFRQPQFLGRAIESCLEQDVDNIEVIVVEDRSRDSSLGLALSYASNAPVQVIECSHNGGLGKARNIGIAHATGEYLCFLDSDDYLLDQSLSARLDAMDDAVAQHGDAVVGVYGDWLHVAEAVDYPETVRAPRSNMGVVSAETYTGENVFICSAPLVRRDAVVAAGGFPEGLAMLEDFALWAMMLARGAVFVPVSHMVSTYRQRPNSMLRGDGVQIMANHARVINDWMAAEGHALSDGGGMTAWLANATPFSYGRMSWNVPSVLGSLNGAPGAEAVHTADNKEAESASVDAGLVPDFMHHSTRDGPQTSEQPWMGRSHDRPEIALVVSTLEHSLEAIGIEQQLASAGTTVGFFVPDPKEWARHWPLALAGHSVRPTSELQTLVDSNSASPTLVDLAAPDHRFADSAGLLREGADAVWPGPHERTDSIVYVPESLSSYPAIDAWISTALHALADAGHNPRVMRAPGLAGVLRGYRTDVVSIQGLLETSMVVAPTGGHLSLLRQLCSTIVFDPSNPAQADAHNAAALRRSIRATHRAS